MIGAFISDDYYFFFESDAIRGLHRTKDTLVGMFVQKDTKLGEDGEPRYLRMKLLVSIDYGTETEPPDSRIDIDFRKKQCHVKFSPESFEAWFLEPDVWIRSNGPNWRYASANVYIKTDESDDMQTFRNTIVNFMAHAPEPPRPNYEKIRKLKRARKP